MTVAVAFFISVVYAAIHAWVFPDSLATDHLLDNMTDVFKAVVVTYGVKAGFENVWKIAKDRRNEDFSDSDDGTSGSDL